VTNKRDCERLKIMKNSLEGEERLGGQRETICFHEHVHERDFFIQRLSLRAQGKAFSPQSLI